MELDWVQRRTTNLCEWYEPWRLTTSRAESNKDNKMSRQANTRLRRERERKHTEKEDDDKQEQDCERVLDSLDFGDL